MISTLTFLDGLTADSPAIVNGREPADAPESHYSDAARSDGLADGGFAPVATSDEGLDLRVKPHLGALDLLVIDRLEGREPEYLPSLLTGLFGRQPDRDANGETALQRAERWQAEARATGKLRPGESWATP